VETFIECKMSSGTIVRKPLLNAAIDGRRVAAVDVREISFEPGQKTGRHLHPCPVLRRSFKSRASLIRS